MSPPHHHSEWHLCIIIVNGTCAPSQNVTKEFSEVKSNIWNSMQFYQIDSYCCFLLLLLLFLLVIKILHYIKSRFIKYPECFFLILPWHARYKCDARLHHLKSMEIMHVFTSDDDNPLSPTHHHHNRRIQYPLCLISKQSRESWTFSIMTFDFFKIQDLLH